MAKFSLRDDILGTLRTWLTELRNLTFSDNFKGYEWEGDITAGETVKITHSLKVIPTRFLVTQAKGNNLLIMSDTPRATSDFFYITNTATTTTFNGKVLILP